MELGCSTILYGGQDLSLALDKIAGAGYNAVEVCAIQNMAPHLNLGATSSICKLRAPAGQTETGRHVMQTLEVKKFREQFNAASHSVRLVTLLSPT